MKPVLLLILSAFSLNILSQNIHTFEADSNIHFCLAYLMKIASWKDPHYIAILDDGSGDMDNIESRLFWSKKSVQDSLILHDSSGIELRFNSPLAFLNFMYVHGFELEKTQPFGARRSYRHNQESQADIISGESCYFFFRRRR
jgi:hypothetical protein